MSCQTHCWHVTSSTTDGMGEKGYDSVVCCHCGRKREQHWRWKDDAMHGPFSPVKIRVDTKLAAGSTTKERP